MASTKDLHELLDKIERCSKETRVTIKDRLKLETEKMYAYHALDICLHKLSNENTSSGKEGLQRTKVYFDKIEKLDF